MTQDLQKDFTTGPTYTFLSTDINDDASSAIFPATGIDLGNPAPLRMSFKWKSVGTAAGCVGPAFLKIAWSDDNSDFPDVDNAELIAVVDMNGTTTVFVIGSFDVQHRYCKFFITNESGANDYDASGSDLILTDMTGDQA